MDSIITSVASFIPSLSLSFYPRLAEYESEILILKEELAAKESALADLQAVNQVLRDEYQTLNLAFTALEDKYRKAQVCG